MLNEKGVYLCERRKMEMCWTGTLPEQLGILCLLTHFLLGLLLGFEAKPFEAQRALPSSPSPDTLLGGWGGVSHRLV